MKLFRINHAGETRAGVLTDAGAYLLRAGADPLRALTDPAYAEEQGTDERVSLEGELLPPLTATCVRDFITFEQHTAGSLKAVTGQSEVPPVWFEIPGFYFTNPHALVGHGADIPMPPDSARLDFECEVAVIIGRDGYNLTPEEAYEHIAGFTIFNDWSARDLQAREMKLGLGPAKGKDTATTIGPVIISLDEVRDVERDGYWDLRMESRINGELVGSDTLANMAWRFADLIAYASRGTWVRAGDVIGSGTCGGGCLAELWGWNGADSRPSLQVGDVIELTVERIGTLRNHIVPGPPVHEIPAARRVQWQAPGTS